MNSRGIILHPTSKGDRNLAKPCTKANLCSRSSTQWRPELPTATIAAVMCGSKRPILPSMYRCDILHMDLGVHPQPFLEADASADFSKLPATSNGSEVLCSLLQGRVAVNMSTKTPTHRRLLGQPALVCSGTLLAGFRRLDLTGGTKIYQTDKRSNQASTMWLYLATMLPTQPCVCPTRENKRDAASSLLVLRRWHRYFKVHWFLFSLGQLSA